MSYIRSFLPNYVGDLLGYYYGMSAQMIQPYVPSNGELYHIIDNVYLGNLAIAVNKEKLHAEGITHIISIMNGSYSMYPDQFKYKHVHINDDPWLSIDKYFDDCIRFIESAKNEGGKVLVHCMCGISRSVTIIGAYMIKTYKMSFNDTIKYLKEKKQTINPNDGFILQLKKFEKSLKLF